MYKKYIKIFKKNKIKFEKGLTANEIKEIQKIYGIVFPKSMKKFLMCLLPISEGFYNWRDFSEENIKEIKAMINYPKQYIYDMTEEVEWNETWGEEPVNKEKRREIIIDKLNYAPQLIPLFSYRYVPMIKMDDPPIISVHGTDIIYYGKNLKNYIETEFSQKEDEAMEDGEFSYIVFWSDIM